MRKAASPARAERHLGRVRGICLALPGASERLSHGEPTFFTGKRVFAMFSNNHHGDGRLAVIVPAELGMQDLLIDRHPRRYFYPAYVGSAGWVGVELSRVGDAELARVIRAAWRLVAPKRAVKAWNDGPRGRASGTRG
ncbi:MAG: MmcQ/YjbR family DNA-binding protein [Phycisphaerae bacterium]|nr:MmcQ/YjbR family DNA-binding protein [Phycisphaerae bacterium]